MAIADGTSSGELFRVTDGRPKQATVYEVGRFYARPGRIHGHIVEQVTVTAHAHRDCVYLDIHGTNRSLCYQLSRQQFSELAGVLDDKPHPADAGRATPDARP